MTATVIDLHAGETIAPADAGQGRSQVPVWADVRPVTTDDDGNTDLTTFDAPGAVFAVYQHRDAEGVHVSRWLADFADRGHARAFARALRIPVTVSSADPDECHDAESPA